MAQSTQSDYKSIQRRLRKTLRLAGCLKASVGATERSCRLRSSCLRRIEWMMGANKHAVHVPTVKTDRLTLRGFEPDDVDRLATLLGNPAVMRYMPVRKPLSRKQAAASLRRIPMCWYQHGRGRWAVICNEDAWLMGWCGLEYLPEVDETELLYLFGPEYWGKGYATEAAHASLRWGFEELGLERIIGVAFSENAASRRVLEKNGLVYQGTCYISECHMVQYAITRDAFRPSEGTYRVGGRTEQTRSYATWNVRVGER